MLQHEFERLTGVSCYETYKVANRVYMSEYCTIDKYEFCKYWSKFRSKINPMYSDIPNEILDPRIAAMRQEQRKKYSQYWKNLNNFKRDASKKLKKWRGQNPWDITKGERPKIYTTVKELRQAGVKVFENDLRTWEMLFVDQIYCDLTFDLDNVLLFKSK